MAQTAYRESFRKSKHGSLLCYIVRSHGDDAQHSSHFRDSRPFGDPAVFASGLSIVRVCGLPDLRLCLTRKTNELPLPDATGEQLRHKSAKS